MTPVTRLKRMSRVGNQAEKKMMLTSSGDYMEANKSSPNQPVSLSKRGASAKALKRLAKDMAVSENSLAGMLEIPYHSADFRSRRLKPLSTEQESLLLGIVSLIGQVQTMVLESGNPDGFHAAVWTARWLERPLPALGWQKPAQLMSTRAGQAHISSIIACMQSGAYL